MYSSSWDTPIIPRITFPKNPRITSHIPKFPEEDNLNHHVLQQSIDFHGKSLAEKLTESLINDPTICEVPYLDNEGIHFKELQKFTSVIPEYEEMNTEILDFICEKAPCIFKTYGRKLDVGYYHLFQWKCYIAVEKYNCLPPLEHFLKVGPDVCEQEFYKSVCAGDILFGKVIDHCDDTHILQIIATGGYHHRNLLGTNIKAELRWDDFALDNTLHPEQNVLSDDTDTELGTQMLEIDTLLTVEVLHTPDIIDGKIDTGNTILVGTKGVVIANLYYEKMDERSRWLNKFILGRCDIENSTNLYPSSLKSIESNEVHSYDECLMKLKLNVNSRCKSIKSMCRCLNLHDTFYNSLMPSVNCSSQPQEETKSIRKVQNEEWIQTVCERKSLLKNDDYINAAKEAFKDVSYHKHPNMVMYHAIYNKNLERYKDALCDIKILSKSDYEAMKSDIFEIILEYARERESTQNFRESEKLYEKCIEINPENEEAQKAVERLKELDSEDGKDQGVENLEKLLEVREDALKSVKGLSNVSLNSSLEELIEAGVVKVFEDEETAKYHCSICSIFAFGYHINNHIGSKLHSKNFKLVAARPYENPESLREDIKEGLETGLLRVNKNPKKGTLEHYDCTVCDKTMTGINSVILHLDSKKHELTVKQVLGGGKSGDMKPVDEAMDSGIIKWDSKTKSYQCVPCDFTVKTVPNVLYHILAKKHIDIVKKIKENEAIPFELQEHFDSGVLTKKKPIFGISDHVLCTVCDISTSDYNGMVVHLGARKHQTNIQGKKPDKRNDPDGPRYLIRVTNIPLEATVADVINCFSRFGKIKDIHLKLKENGALFEMFQEEDAEAIINSHSQEAIQLHGQDIYVFFANQRKLGEIPETRVLLLLNLDVNEAKTNNRSVINMASPYGEVTGVKVMDPNERDGSRKALLEMVDKDAARNFVKNFPLSQKQGENVVVKYSAQEKLKKCYRPQKGKKTGAKAGNLTGGNANFEPLPHEIKSDHQFTSQKKDLPPKTMSEDDYLANMKKEMFKGNLPNKPSAKASSFRDQYSSENSSFRDQYSSESSSVDRGQTMLYKSRASFTTSQKKDLPPKKISDEDDQSDYLLNMKKRMFDSNVHHKPSAKSSSFRDQYSSENSSVDRGQTNLYNRPLTNIHKEVATTVVDYGHQKKNTSISPNSNARSPFALQDDFRKENIARDEWNTSEYYKRRKSDNFDAQDILPGYSKERMREPIQSERKRQTISTNITQSFDLSSGTAAELENITSSMSAAQRKKWEHRFGEHVKSIEQEIEEAFEKSSEVSMDDTFSSNFELGESRKRKHFNEKQEEAYSMDFAGRKTLGHSEKRSDYSSNDEETSGFKKQKVLLEDENPLDKSKFNLYARGLSIDRTRQEVHDFFSVHGVITDVHLEWCTEPKFVGEQSAYIAFTKIEDVAALVDQHQNLHFKDSLISLQMYIDSSESNCSVIHVSGITYVYSNTKRELANYFSIFGSVKAVLINTASRNSHYAFVVFDSKDAAKEIISTKEPFVFDKDTLKLKEAKLLHDEKSLEKLEITQKTMSVPDDKFVQLINQSVNIMKDIMIETGATYELIRNKYITVNKTLMIHGTPEQIFSAKKLINEKSGLQKSNKLREQKTESDPPKILIIADQIYKVLETVCTSEVDLEQNICVRILENMTLPMLSNEVSMILNEMTDVKYVVFVFGIRHFTENINTSKGLILVPNEDVQVMREFLEYTQTISDRLQHQFPLLKIFWTTPTPYSFEKYNRKKMSRKKNDNSPQLLPTHHWKKIQSNFHKCLIHLRKSMLESDPHYTVDFLKLFQYNEHSSDELTGEQMLVEGEVPKEEWFAYGYMKLNARGGKALRYCIRKTVQRDILWGSDSEGKAEWAHHIRAMLDNEQQERNQCHRDLKLLPLPDIDVVIREQAFESRLGPRKGYY